MSSPAPTARRKSGRAVKIPEKFVPEVSASQGGSSSTKRKRSGQDAENDASSVEDEEEEISDEEVDTEEEEAPKSSRRKAKSSTARKPAAKKPRTNGKTNQNGDEDQSAPAPAIRLPARPKKSRKAVINDEDVEGLYGEVYASDRSLRDVVGEWLVRHGENGPLAVTELLNFVLKSAGCDIELTEDHINDTDAADGTVVDLQNQFQAQNITDYPLISKAKGSHDFRKLFMDFWTNLVDALHESEVLYNDAPVIENIHVWISTLTSSTSRPFRHTATLVALTIMTAMCAIANSQIEASAKVQRQAETEKKKKTSNKGRLADFQKNIALIENRKDFVDAQLNDFYSTIYSNRYRDVDAKIRLECAEALGAWMSAYPSYFFKEEYLRYMGWMLSDAQHTMRLEIVKQITGIMKKEENRGHMRHFIERFRPRMIEIAAQDSEPSVRVAAVYLADVIRQAGFLEPDDIDTVGKLIFDAEPRVRKAVVGFFCENVKDLYEAKFDELGGAEALEGFVEVEDEDDKESLRVGWLHFKDLAEIMSSYDGEEREDDPSQLQNVKYLNVTGSESRFSLAAQALYEKMEELQDWESLAGYLLFDHSSQKRGAEAELALRDALKPDEREEFILLEVLHAVVKSATKSLETTVADRSNKASRAEATEMAEATARHLAEVIPRLLQRFGPDPRTAAVVLRLEHVLNLDVYQELRQNSTEFSKHLDDITAQFNAHADDNVLREAGAVFLRAKGIEELEEVAESKIQSLWDDAMLALRNINTLVTISERGNLSINVLTELSHNLARLAELCKISSPIEALEQEGASDDTFPILILLDIIIRGVYEESDDAERDAVEDAVVVSAIRAAAFYFMWKVRVLHDAVSAGEEVADVDVDQLKDWSETFSVNLISAFSSRSTLDPVRIIGAGTLLENHVLFHSLQHVESGKGKQRSNVDYSHLETLIKPIVPDVQQEIASIFDGLEKQFAKRARKKLAPPGDDEEPEDYDEEVDDEEEEDTDSDRLIQTLKAEQELCDLTGKIVLAILAGAIDKSGSLKGKLRTRLQRNHLKLGNNFKEVINYLDEPKVKKARSQASKTQQNADAKKNAKSKEIVEDDEDEEDDIVDEEPEEGTVEDLRRRELLDEEPEGSVEAADDADDGEPDDDDEVMGD